MFKKKDSKYILAHGCSFTDFNFVSKKKDADVSFTKWPEILGKRLGVPVKNLAGSGFDNGTIFDETIDQILKEKPWMVVIGITEIPRFRMYGVQALQCIPSWQMTHSKWLKDMSRDTTHEQLLEPWLEWLWSKHNERPTHLFTEMVDNHWKRIIRLQRLCDKLGIKLIMTHMLIPFNYRAYFKVIPTQLGLETKISRSGLLNSMMTPNFDHVDDKSFIGWPNMPDIGEGWHILDYDKPDKVKHLNWSDDCLIDVEEDTHPNKKGHEIIAECFYEHYQKTYT